MSDERCTRFGVARTAMAIMIASSIACGHENSDVPRLVTSYCHELAFNLTLESEAYAKRLKIMSNPNLTADQQQRAEVRFGAGELGSTSRHGRISAAIAMQRQFAFCMLVRKGDETARYDRFSILASAFWESDDLPVLAKTVAEMAALASEMASLPLKN